MSHQNGGRNVVSSTSELIEVKSKFDAEFRRFSIARRPPPTMEAFRSLLHDMHALEEIPFTLCYTDGNGDLLPITNEENFKVALNSAKPLLRVLLQRKGESWEEKYGYGNADRKRKGLSTFLGVGSAGNDVSKRGRNYIISQPEDFRLVSAVIDVDLVPDQHRRVKLCKHGSSRPLGFYIRDGTSVRVTKQGIIKMPGIFISRLIKNGLAESTGLLAVNDEVLEVNGVQVLGKTLDQVTDMMVANASNLIITVKPVDQHATLTRGINGRFSGHSELSEGARSSIYETNSDNDEDDVKDFTVIGAAK